MKDQNMNIWSFPEIVKLHGQPRYVEDFTDENGRKFAALSFDAKSFADNEIKTYDDLNGNARKSSFVMVTFAPNLPNRSMQYITEHFKEMLVRQIYINGETKFVLEPIIMTNHPKTPNTQEKPMTKTKFLTLLVIALVVIAVLSILVGVQTYEIGIKFEDSYNVTSWLSLLLPGVLSYTIYRRLKYLFDSTLGLVVAITLMVLSFVFVTTLPAYNQSAAAVVEAINFGLLVFVIGIISIYKILSKHFDNYQNLE